MDELQRFSEELIFLRAENRTFHEEVGKLRAELAISKGKLEGRLDGLDNRCAQLTNDIMASSGQSKRTIVESKTALTKSLKEFGERVSAKQLSFATKEELKTIKETVESIRKKCETVSSQEDIKGINEKLGELATDIKKLDDFISGCRRRRDAWDLIFKIFGVIKANITWILVTIGGIIGVIKFFL
jgi:DNA anti-recombination protein RmuC